MSETVATVMASAAQSLRDTAKWLVGGVAATAAGVFAGSPLSSLGSLDPMKDTDRLVTAGAGVIVGLGALAFIFSAAIRVLTRESLTMREIGLSTDPEVVTVRAALEGRYKANLPPDAPSLPGYVDAVDEALENPTAPANAELIERARRDNTIISADAGFQLVRARFDDLIRTLKWATALAIVGFGVFAWAANPPKSSAPPAACSFTIQGATVK